MSGDAPSTAGQHFDRDSRPPDGYPISRVPEPHPSRRPRLWLNAGSEGRLLVQAGDPVVPRVERGTQIRALVRLV
jgi:hypothetical protein